MGQTDQVGDRNKRRYRWRQLQRRLDDYAEYILLAGPLIILLLVLGLPVLFNTYISFFQWNGTGWPEQFVGLSNYLFIFQDSTILRSVINTTAWTVTMVIVPPAVGLGLALLINNLSFESLFKTVFFLPYAISFVAIGIMWQLMYDGDFGVINELLRLIGLGELARAWMGVPWVNTFAMMVAQGWLFAAFAMVVYLAGLQSIPEELTEAAKIDGLSRVQKFRYVTFPMLRPFTTLVVATILFRVLKIFDIIWVMSRGGPFNSSETLAVSMYRIAFSQFNFGRGSAVANVLTVLIVIVTVIYIRYNIKREVEY
jgi:ABC-type sugar transport system permease subunit